MDSTWDKSCITASSDDLKYMTSLELESNFNTAATDEIFYYHRGLGNLKAEKPILVLLHGYPQTNFMWRHVISLLPKDIPIFIPDLPGYGRSSPLSIPHTKRNVGVAILSKLHSLLPKSNTPHPIILAGHDRGARICQRLAVDAPTDSRFAIKGSVLLDIIPANVQWESATFKSAVGFYHWLFLANVELATSMIMAFGGDNYVRTSIARWRGKNETAVKKMNEHDSESVYANFFKYGHVIRASCDDYRASADEEIEEHEEDQKAGRGMDCDVLALYSATFLPTRGKVDSWLEWMGKGKLETKGFGDGVGHFVAEEAPEQTAEAILDFYNKHI